MSEKNEIVNLKEFIVELKENFLNSHWPKCNKIADQLYGLGTEEARKALLEGLKAKRHHIRTAAIKALTKFHDVSLVEYIKPFINDPAYETRTQAIESIKELTGEDLSIGKKD